MCVYIYIYIYIYELRERPGGLALDIILFYAQCHKPYDIIRGS